MHGLLCILPPHIPHSAIEVLHTLVDPVQDFLFQVHNVHNILPDRVLLLPNKNTVTVEKHCEVVHGIQKSMLCVKCFVCHIPSRLYLIDF